MKVSKLFAALVVSGTLFATVADAGSIGRSGGSASRSSSSSVSKSSSFSSPSKPAPAPAAPAAAPSTRPGGIGGNSGSMGVRKSEVTAPVAQKTNPPSQTTTTSSGTSSAPPNSGGYSGGGFSGSAPQYGNSGGGGLGMGGVFASSLGGSLAGTVLGNALFGNHGSHGGGTTVINNGVPTGGTVQSLPAASDGTVSGIGQSQVLPNGQTVQSQSSKGYTMWNFIGDVIAFAILVALVVGIAFLFYKGFKMVKNYINRERGVGESQPFSPTARFWEIQRAFAAADVALLKTLLGPDLVDEATQNLEPFTLTLSGVSHEVVLTTPREFSIHYTFTDADETINQVWHYEKFGNVWQLNGIENV